ncbi:hypothetical protein CKO10_05555 [Rhodospirillum rubrum]|uniref:cell division protein FtsL n=2 Tax=Rhodospirillum rubrum TaxID=1085 RepID=UPI001907684E|nr:hypothetical protein [Rhodospirillum rubrum]MBK1663968.1 hypothetical protein [Rhodospirillum rubrum]
MIRPIHIIWAALIMGIGTALFMVAYEVDAKEKELTRLHADIRRTTESMHVLRAEWSFLNDPTRLDRLATDHLGLQPIRPEQYVTVASLPARPAPLPAPSSKTEPPAPGDVPMASLPNGATTGSAQARVAGGGRVTVTPVPTIKPMLAKLTKAGGGQ